VSLPIIYEVEAYQDRPESSALDIFTMFLKQLGWWGPKYQLKWLLYMVNEVRKFPFMRLFQWLITGIPGHKCGMILDLHARNALGFRMFSSNKTSENAVFLWSTVQNHKGLASMISDLFPSRSIWVISISSISNWITGYRPKPLSCCRSFCCHLSR